MAATAQPLGRWVLSLLHEAARLVRVVVRASNGLVALFAQEAAKVELQLLLARLVMWTRERCGI